MRADRGGQNIIQGNVCLDNSQRAPGRYSGIAAVGAGTQLSGNSGTIARSK